MSYALNSGVTGLVCHQRMLDVVANNLANLNTTGYKYGQTRFADLLYVPILRSTGGVGTQGGGNNPAELGAGVKIAEITRKFSQGNLEGTGEMFDFAIQGDGLFVLNDGTKNLYTRDGSFGLDGLGYLVDPATGNRVQRFGTLGDDSATSVGFQVRGNSDIRVPLGATIPGQVTSAINILGNLDASSPGPARAEFQSVNPLVSGGVAATAATRLNDLDTNLADYIAGDTIEITGGDVDGTAISGSLAVDATTTVGDMLAAINAAFNQATATLDASGRIVLRADHEGAALLNLSLKDASGNTGQFDWDRHRMALVTQGRDGAQSETIVEIYDILGTARALKLTFQKQAASDWRLTASLNAADGSVVGSGIAEIQFSEDGSVGQITGEGGGPAEVELLYLDQGTPQRLVISIDGLTQMAVSSSWAVEQDGFSAGTLASVHSSADGVLTAVASNGRQVTLAQLAIASFANLQGLYGQGENYFTESSSSGAASIGAAASGSRGVVRSGQLEGSNVDVGAEFTRLIVAQRGFSVNARTITVASQVLEELVNVVR